VRRRVLELLARTEDDLTDAELFAQQSDEFWFVELCTSTLHRLPSEIELILTCREYTLLQAHSIVSRAIHDMQHQFREGG
jgi:hypothetical protein